MGRETRYKISNWTFQWNSFFLWAVSGLVIWKTCAGCLAVGDMSQTINEQVCPDFVPTERGGPGPVKLLAIARLFSFQTLSGSQTWDGGSLSRTVDLGSVDCSAEPRLHNGWGRLRPHRPFTRNSKSKIKFQPIKVPPARAADRNPKKEIWEIRNAHPGSKLEASTTSTEMLTLEPISWKRSQSLSKTRLTIKLLQSFFKNRNMSWKENRLASVGSSRRSVDPTLINSSFRLYLHISSWDFFLLDSFFHLKMSKHQLLCCYSCWLV